VGTLHSPIERISMEEHSAPQTADETPAPAPTAAAPGGAPAPSGNGASPAPPLGSILDELAAQMQDAAAKAAESEQASHALEDDLAQLQAAYDDVGKVVDAYREARPALTEQLDESKHYAERKEPVILADVGGDKDAVDAAWKEVRDELIDLEKQVHDRWSDVIAAQNALAESTQARDAAVKALDDLKDRQNVVTAQLGRIDGLKAGIEAADAEDDGVGMYVRFLEYQRELKGAQDALGEVDAYKATLEDAWRDLEHAKADVRQKDADRVHAQNQYDLVKAALDRLAPNRVDEVLKRVAVASVPAASASS
jgi:chromosome segregation ATPase